MKFILSGLVILLSLTAMANTGPAQNDPAAAQETIGTQIDGAFALIETGLDESSEDKAATMLRQAFIATMTSDDVDQRLILKISVGQFALREYIVAQYGIHDYEASKLFIDYAKILTLPPKDMAAFAIRMAKTLDHSAILWLETIYSYDVEGYDPTLDSILQYFMTTLREELPRSIYFAGKMFLNGIRMYKNEEQGIELLEYAAEFIDGPLIELINYTYAHNDKDAFLNYLAQGVAREIPQAMYNHAVLQQQAGHYAEALAFFNKTLEAQPDYYAAKLELARMYVEGWGMEKSPANIKKGVALFKELAKEDKPDKIRALALVNLSALSQKGIEVKQSDLQAKRYMNKAKKLGFDVSTLAGN